MDTERTHITRPGSGPDGEVIRPDATGIVGRRLGSYQVMRKIGQGGMGMVFEAFEPTLERTVALKVLPPQLAEDHEWVARFVREARTAARLDHPSIASIYAADQTDDGLCYIAMQYVEGEDLGSWIRRNGALPISVALKVTREIAIALDAAHELGVVHRDIKPDNLRVEPSGRVTVMDFGLAVDRRNQRITDVGMFLGTPEYCSPEQCEAAETDVRSDLYSLGVVLYEMVSGQVPHRADTPYKLFRKIIEEPPLPVRDIDSSIPKGVGRVLDRLLQKHPDDRYQTAAELIADLDKLVRHEQVDLAQFYAENVSEAEMEAGAATVAFSGDGTEGAARGAGSSATTLVAGRSTTSTRGPRSTSRSTSRKTFAAAALRQGPHPAVALAMLALVMVIGAAAIMGLPETHVLPVLEARGNGDMQLEAPAPAMKDNRIAILGFEEQGGTNPKLAWLKACLPEMLALNLSQLPTLEVVSSREAAQAMKVTGREKDAAHRLGARLLISGVYFTRGDKVHLVATFKVVENGVPVVKGGVPVDGPEEDFLSVIEDCARKLASLCASRAGVGDLQANAELRGLDSQLVGGSSVDRRDDGATNSARPERPSLRRITSPPSEAPEDSQESGKGGGNWDAGADADASKATDKTGREMAAGSMGAGGSKRGSRGPAPGGKATTSPKPAKTESAPGQDGSADDGKRRRKGFGGKRDPRIGRGGKKGDRKAGGKKLKRGESENDDEVAGEKAGQALTGRGQRGGQGGGQEGGVETKQLEEQALKDALAKAQQGQKELMQKELRKQYGSGWLAHVERSIDEMTRLARLSEAGRNTKKVDPKTVGKPKAEKLKALKLQVTRRALNVAVRKYFEAQTVLSKGKDRDHLEQALELLESANAICPNVRDCEKQLIELRQTLKKNAPKKGAK